METIIEKKKEKLTRLSEDILIYVDSDYQIKFKNVFKFIGNEDKYIGHFNIWNDNAPFYILFKRSDIKKLNIKGYKKCTFIPNSFVIGYDKNNKMYLRCNTEHPQAFIKYYPILSINDIRSLVEMRKAGAHIYAGFPTSKGISKIGEAIQLINY